MSPYYCAHTRYLVAGNNKSQETGPHDGGEILKLYHLCAFSILCELSLLGILGIPREILHFILS